MESVAFPTHPPQVPSYLSLHSLLLSPRAQAPKEESDTGGQVQALVF